MEFHLLLLDDGLDLPMLGTDDFQQILSKGFRACNLLFVWATDVTPSVMAGWRRELRYERDMDVHRLVGFSPCLLIHKTRTDTLNLHPRLCLLLNVFHKNALSSCQRHVTRTSSPVAYRWSNDLRPNIKVSDRFEANRKLLFGPFAL